jgi:hypothetical protein
MRIKLLVIAFVSRLALVPIGQCEWRLEQEENLRKWAFSRRPEGGRSRLPRRRSTEQDCYGEGIHFDGAWTQKWAQFEKLADS